MAPTKAWWFVALWRGVKTMILRIIPSKDDLTFGHGCDDDDETTLLKLELELNH